MVELEGFISGEVDELGYDWVLFVEFIEILLEVVTIDLLDRGGEWLVVKKIDFGDVDLSVICDVCSSFLFVICVMEYDIVVVCEEDGVELENKNDDGVMSR